MRAFLLAVALVLLLLPAAPASAAPGTLTVSLTFDDGFKSQADAAQVLAKHRMNGTFYVINGLVGYGDYLSWADIDALAAQGNEIGGHTVTHPHLDQLPYAQAKAEICDNRATLLARGYRVTSFAYPYGSPSADNERQAAECGYNSARDVSGLVDAENASCLDCALANPVPPADLFRIRGNSSTTDHLAGVEQYVTQALQHPGASWVPLIFHRFCTSACASEKGDEYMSIADFDRLLTWLAQQPGVVVRTVQQVVGGPVRPSVGTPTPDRVAPAAVSDAVAWRPFDVPIGQEQVLVGGLVVAVCAVGVFRLSRRGRRYVR
ncbi:polysaccharide deacetylase family protein [Cryptosporangium phraense]|uniref:Polysaccharide deacetylase family protein n=1 Tax=Cryptosporangium phraense TaxID=2593070 RepID=A0A545AUN4_9ACTN|nr:polysaccharide deacetylase family protein [Cryptosporangium phraense]TQS45049.1 polysaccharide deacetylase family protein [Cryptosporangium phraense]